MSSLNKFSLVAPCEINCRVFKAYLRERNKCPGGRGDDIGKPVTRVRCKIKNCELFKDGETAFCFECEDLPCESLKRLDKRYRTKYNMSPLENLQKLRFCCLRNLRFRGSENRVFFNAENLKIFERLENIKNMALNIS